MAESIAAAGTPATVWTCAGFQLRLTWCLCGNPTLLQPTDSRAIPAMITPRVAPRVQVCLI